MAALWVAMSKFDEPGCDYSVASRDPPNATSFIPKFPTIPWDNSSQVNDGKIREIKEQGYLL